MFDWLGVLDFLDSREKAILFWALTLLVFVTVKSDGFGTSLLDVLRAFAAPKLLFLFGSAALYCTTLVLLAEKLGLWHTTAIKETVYWFVGTGVVLVGNATLAAPDDPDYWKRLLRHAVRFTIIVEFLVNLYVLPFAVELFLVPSILLFVGMQVVAAQNPRQAQARPFIDGVLGVISLVMLAYVAVSAIRNLDGFLTRETGEDFLVAPGLTLALFPFLYCLASVSRREQQKLHKRFRSVSNSPA